MRRSLAPSKAFASPAPSPSSSLLIKRKRDEEDSDSEDSSGSPRVVQAFQKPRIVGPSSVGKPRAPLNSLSNDSAPAITANPLGSLKKPFKVPIPGYVGETSKGGLGVKKARPRGPLFDPDVPGAVVLYRAPPLSPQDAINPEIKSKHPVDVVVDPILGKRLRPHQIEGVQFLYDCTTGVRSQEHMGCIMADEMGLGKTFQCITLVWTLLKQSPRFGPEIEKAVIVAPSSLVKNWANEFGKWVGANRISPLAVDGGSAEEIDKELIDWMNASGRGILHPVLVISYETFRLHAHVMTKPVGIVICDEGHRLKNLESQTYKSLMTLQTKRRIIISGTPIQNDLLEYFSLVQFCNPGMLGSMSEFRKKFENPILRSRDAGATDKEVQVGQECLNAMGEIVNRCIIRRTNDILSKYLPPKVEQVVCIHLTEMQKAIYKAMISSKEAKAALKDGSTSSSLAFITTLKKLCNHPSLVEDKIRESKELSALAGDMLKSKQLQPELSGKLQVLDKMLALIKKTTKDKIVLVSNYTQTLDMFERLCKARMYHFLRLDGTLSIKNRQKLVDQFNDKHGQHFIFMLSSKAGGCGLNLIGANRLVMFDPDWNPANDEQAMARVWRDGQGKGCFVYRFVSTGTIEEKIFQRQKHKKALSSCVIDEQEDVERYFTNEDLRNLFALNEDTISETHDKFNCKKCPQPGKYIPFHKVPEETVKGILDDLAEWDHYSNVKKIKDQILRESAGEVVSFVFRAQSHENPITEAPSKEELEEAERKDKERERLYAEESDEGDGSPSTKAARGGDGDE